MLLINFRELVVLMCGPILGPLTILTNLLASPWLYFNARNFCDLTSLFFFLVFLIFVMFLLKSWSSSGRIFSQIWWYSKYESKNKILKILSCNCSEFWWNVFCFLKEDSICERVFFFKLFFRKWWKFTTKTLIMNN
jgi:hypothetical protein